MRTLAGRVAILTSLVVAIGFALTGALIVNATGRAQIRLLEADLGERLVLFERTVSGPPSRPGRPGLPITDQLQDLRRAGERALGPGTFLAVRTQRDGAVLTIGDVPETLPPEPPTPSAASRPGTVSAATRFVEPQTGTAYLVRHMQLAGPGRPTLQIGADIDREITAQQDSLRQRFILLGGIATAIVGLATILTTSLATRPLRRLRDATQAVAETEDLTTRVTLTDATREVEAVAEGLNTMLSRLQRSASAREAALHAARRFAADAGHEMRTPLTAVQTTLDALERNPDLDAAARREAIGEVAEETRRLARLLESLQMLARADAAGAVGHELVQLDDVVGQAISRAAATHPDLHVSSDVHPVTVAGARPWLRSMVDNLLRNAAVHASRGPGAPVTANVTLTHADGWALLTVDDDGPGIPASERARALERFTRGADAGSRPGHGLGLSLVAQMAALHGGALRLDDAPLGGLRAQVRLPPASAVRAPGR